MSNVKELKAQADELGISYAKNASVAQLKSKIESAKLDGLSENSTTEPTNKQETSTMTAEEARIKRLTKKRAEAQKLVRVIVSCNDATLDTDKRQFPVKVSNKLLGVTATEISYGSRCVN
jgi:hypothetical protein